MPPKQETYSFNQIKEILEMHQETMMKFFNTTVDRLEIKIKYLTEDNIVLKRELNDVKESIQFHSETVETKFKMFEEKKQNYEKTNENELIKDMMVELEHRSRRNNLRFEGIMESEDETWEESEEKVQEMIKEQLKLNGDIKIERAHRDSKMFRNDNTKNNKRTIIAKFLNYEDKAKVLSEYKAKRLWQSEIYVNEDFSERTARKRKELFKKVKELKDKGIKAKVVYNKLCYNVLRDNTQK